jgi:hypothetical protein
MTQDPVKKSDELDRRLEEAGIEKVIENVYVSAKRYHLTIFAILLAFDLVLSSFLCVIAWQNRHIANTAKAAGALARITCIADNQAKSEETKLWNYILSFPPNPNLSQAEQARIEAQINEFRKFLSTQLAAQEC